jgi:hypothetical protein
MGMGRTAEGGIEILNAVASLQAALVVRYEL